MKKRVVFRADGSLEIGYGHFIRTLGIAGLINDEFDCIYATISPTDYQLQEIRKVCSGLIELSKENSVEEFLTHLKKDDIVVIDDYHSKGEYQQQIRNNGCKVVYIDDHNDKYYVCDALVNNIPGFDADSFHKEPYTQLFLGTDYALLRKEFFDPEKRRVVKNNNSVFLSFGGGDFYNISEKTIDFLTRINPNIEINLLIGDAYKYYDNLKRFSGLKIHKNLSAEEVANLIAVSEICIVPASSLLNETACISGKIMIGYFADNQIQPYTYFVDNDLALGIGDYREMTFEAFEVTFEKLKNAHYLVDNQRAKYRYQQEDNLKKLFYDI